jgi:malonate decarboxylase delta subunit
MEKLHYDIPSQATARRNEPVLVGVTASGNCEILVETADTEARCRVSVNTSARGFAPIWQAVLTDFGLRHAAGGLAIEINDVGATPAVVSLRLDQAIEEWEARNG